MSEKPTDEEYYQRYTNIYSLLFQAYMDKCVLDSANHLRENVLKRSIQELGNTIMVIDHVRELTKKDLTLVLWKIFFDDGRDANTVKSIKRYLSAKYDYKVKIKETENIKKIRPLICAARKNFLAHNLMSDDGRLLQIPDLVNALEDMRSLFNAVSLDSIDFRATPLTDEKIYGLCFYEMLGFEMMINEEFQACGDDNIECKTQD